MKTFFLVAAVVGAVIPIYFFAQFFGASPAPGIVEFVSALFVNGAAGGFTSDLLISSFVFWAFMWTEQNNGPKKWPFVLLNLFIGLSCALPAYFYFRASK